MLTNGNSKLGKDIYAFGLPAIKTCFHATSECLRYCYAKKGSFLAPNPKAYYTANYKHSQASDFVKQMNGEIAAVHPNYIRIHPSGDFYSQEYFDKWIQIAKDNPSVHFLSYTRNYDLRVENLPSNFALYYSLDKTTSKRSDDINLTALVTPISKPRHMQKVNDAFVCDSKCYKCKACWSGKINIIFPER